jgi:hypothetical protein
MLGVCDPPPNLNESAHAFRTPTTNILATGLEIAISKKQFPPINAGILLRQRFQRNQN